MRILGNILIALSGFGLAIVAMPAMFAMILWFFAFMLVLCALIAGTIQGKSVTEIESKFGPDSFDIFVIGPARMAVSMYESMYSFVINLI